MRMAQKNQPDRVHIWFSNYSGTESLGNPLAPIGVAQPLYGTQARRLAVASEKFIPPPRL